MLSAVCLFKTNWISRWNQFGIFNLRTFIYLLSMSFAIMNNMDPSISTCISLPTAHIGRVFAALKESTIRMFDKFFIMN